MIYRQLTALLKKIFLPGEQQLTLLCPALASRPVDQQHLQLGYLLPENLSLRK